MTPGTFVVVFLLSAFALAVWTDVRWPRLAPQELAPAILHMLGSFVFARFVSWVLATPVQSSQVRLLLIVSLALPAVTYILLASLWMIKLVQRMIGSYLGRGGGGGLRA